MKRRDFLKFIPASFMLPLCGKIEAKPVAPKIELLPGAQNLGDDKDLEYFRKNLFEALKYPEFEFEKFAEKIKFRHPIRGTIPFEVDTHHKKVIEAYDKHRFVIYRKFRQGGFTTMSLIYSLWRTSRFGEKVIYVTKTDREGLMLRDAYVSYLEHIDVRIRRCTDHQVEFANGGRIDFVTPMECRSRASDYLMIDEGAYYGDADGLWKAMFPVIYPNGKAFVFSSPNGARGWFYDMYTKAVRGENKFHVVNVNYMDKKEYRDPSWAEELKKCLGEKLWRQEVLQEFI